MKCKLSEKCEFGNLCKDATRHDSLTVLGCSSFKTKKPMTEQEYLQTCNTEQLAEYLASTFDLCGAGCHHCFLANVCLTKAKNGNCLTQEQMIVEWLKQPKE